MKLTDEMVQAEVDRVDLLQGSWVMLDTAKSLDDAPLAREQFLTESIRSLMIGSHAGRVG